MKNKRILGLFLITCIAVVTFSIYSSTSADGVAAPVPGSVGDPAVSKSYVDEQVKLQVAAQINSQVAEVAAQIEKLKKELPSLGGGSGSGAALTVVQLAAGQTLIAGTGSELIVRTGYVKAVSTDSNGIPDVTAGKDIAIGSAILTNHLLIFPTDKRGIKPDPQKKDPIFVMVRGSFKLINEDGSEGVVKTESVATPTSAPTSTLVPPAQSGEPSNAPVISP